ncbi:hypothetical protein BN59_03806 [Legionella massiliensis]|uniref:Uncharacterized protein n=1 Tax=Legionella massiliensis TaxID=1034943 RepID=A0A078L6G2_9GAMM|nr:DUF5677 domain-containing protein [Legionella massiliensis]CDZ79488.1 hypothetical protein BN59_03806 [Legionella massiliensis]CEE15226.1 hypothetical protein BN1094_03806 [Legionella massiliensis]
MEEFAKKENFLLNYENHLIKLFEKFWGKIEIEYDKLDAYSVIGGLLSRQVTLSIEMARSPNIWNGHSAPLFLRAMIDLFIALAWIMNDLETRAKQYILHGLGDKKLLLEHYKASQLEEFSENRELLIESCSQWINSQRNEHMVEVNLGNWAQLDYRQMAKETGHEDLYNFSYKPFSHASHNMWPHISMYNSKICNNPLHKKHFIPTLIDTELDFYYLHLSCKYLDMTYQLFVDKFSLTLTEPLPLDWLEEHLNNQ